MQSAVYVSMMVAITLVRNKHLAVNPLLLGVITSPKM